jgi:hypothetical protein
VHIFAGMKNRFPNPGFARPSPNPCKQGLPFFWHYKIAPASTSSLVCGSPSQFTLSF